MRQKAPAAARNREPIAAVLAEELPEKGRVLEIASGTGEHALYFAAQFPELYWQPSDPDAAARASVAAWQEGCGLTNIAPPLALDASLPEWPLLEGAPLAADAVLCVNMIHISPWASSVGLFAGSAKVLRQAQDAERSPPLILYGPYFEEGVETAPSNLDFDRSLKERNPAWGIRNIADVDALAHTNGFERTRRVEMPANNLMLVYRITL